MNYTTVPRSNFSTSISPFISLGKRRSRVSSSMVRSIVSEDTEGLRAIRDCFSLDIRTISDGISLPNVLSGRL